MGALIARYVAAKTHTKAIVFAEPAIPTKSPPPNPVPTESYMVQGDIVGKLGGSTHDRIPLYKRPGSACQKLAKAGPFWKSWAGVSAHSIDTYRACMKEHER